MPATATISPSIDFMCSISAIGSARDSIVSFAMTVLPASSIYELFLLYHAPISKEMEIKPFLKCFTGNC